MHTALTDNRLGPAHKPCQRLIAPLSAVSLLLHFRTARQDVLINQRGQQTLRYEVTQAWGAVRMVNPEAAADGIYTHTDTNTHIDTPIYIYIYAHIYIYIYIYVCVYI